MKARILCFLFAFMPLLPIALSGENYVVINFNNGEQKIAATSDVARITFSDGSIVLNLKDNSSFSTALSTLQNIKFSDNNAGVEATELSKIEPSIITEIDRIIVSGISDTTAVTIYSISGAVAKKDTIANGESISISDLPRGIYLINVESSTFKFLKQ
ncbi:MAG: T9SS type A sorting domain-containing protein [Muribaculaceae bacterium]|nr:T9SS type A sorting domain-containing protein [Muribaculaceae bacterium]